MVQSTNPLSMARIIVCDDDRDTLRRLCNLTQAALNRMGIPFNVQGFSEIDMLSPDTLSCCDIALLDVDLGAAPYNGLDIARKLRQVREDAIIIFVTNFIEYAPEGYEVQAFRYLLKKDAPNKLPGYLQEAIQKLYSARQTLAIRQNGEITEVALESIYYIESFRREVCVHTREAKQYRYYAQITVLEEQLAPFGFLRIHKSYLVNMNYLKKYQHNEAVLHNGTTLPVSQSRYKDQKKKYLFWRGC